MPPFMQFRLWLREGPGPERLLGGIAALTVVALVVLALVPVGRGSDDTSVEAGAGAPAAANGATPAAAAGGTQTPAAGAAGSTGGGGAGGTTASGGATSGGGGSSGASAAAVGGGDASAAGDACAGRTASGPGVTASEVKIVTTNISLAGPIGNSTFDIRSDLAAIAKANADDINEHGGVACGRKVALKQYDVNPLDPNDGQSKCLQIQQDQPLLVIDFGGYLTPAARSCFVQAKVPMMAATAMARSEAQGAYPYLISPHSLGEEGIHNGILGLHERGFFNAPKFQKLGVFEDACVPGVNQQIESDLAKVGVKSSQISKFVLDCNVSAPPNQIAQAVLQHKSSGVTHVFFATSATNDQNYVRAANGQSFHPAYGMSDYGETMTGAGTQNWDASFDGAIGITTTRAGETASGIRNDEIQACDQIMKKHGVPGFTSEKKDTSVASYCDLFSFFKAAANRAGINPTRATLARGVSSIGLFKTALAGDGNFVRPGKITGGDFQRALQFHSDCQCWKVVDRDMKAAYQ